MYHSIKNPLKTKCRKCRKEILFDHAGRLYCKVCAVIAHKESRERAHKKRKQYRLTVKANKFHYHKDCRVCGEQFESTRKTRKYCSDKCKDVNFRIERYMNKIIKYQDKIQSLLTNK